MDAWRAVEQAGSRGSRGGWSASQRAFNTALFDAANEMLAAIYAEVHTVPNEADDVIRMLT